MEVRTPALETAAPLPLNSVPAWDFNVDRGWHGHMALMRGVEDGFTLVRAAKTGYLTVSDDRGRILAERRSDLAPFVNLAAPAPAGHSWTVFQLLGDWFGRLSVGLVAWALISLFSSTHAGYLK